MPRPCAGTGSLSPTFVPARAAALAVKLPCAIALDTRLPNGLREPLRASVTLWEATAPVKLPARHCPWRGYPSEVRRPLSAERYFTLRLHGSWRSRFEAYRLCYTTDTERQYQGIVKVPGSFRPSARNEHLYSYCNFAGFLVETAGKSLRHSCRSELARQGISLP